MTNTTVCSVDGCGSVVQARGFCHRCYMRLSYQGVLAPLVVPPIEQRFWQKVNKDGPIPGYAPDLGPCWIWMAALNPQTGYGTFGGGRKTFSAHRWSYKHEVGVIPNGLELDHLCRVRQCVRPSHLEPVTRAVNAHRAAAVRTHCPQGHAYDAANTYVYPSGSRRCRACRNIQMKQKVAR